MVKRLTLALAIGAATAASARADTLVFPVEGADSTAGPRLTRALLAAASAALVASCSSDGGSSTPEPVNSNDRPAFLRPDHLADFGEDEAELLGLQDQCEPLAVPLAVQPDAVLP